MIRALLVLALIGACGKGGEKQPPEPAPGPTEPSEEADRVAGWRADLKTFATELPARHKNLFFEVSEAEFRKAVDELDAELATLRQPEVQVGILRLAAMIGDGHTTAWWSSKMPRMRAPLRLFVFTDGIHVLDAGEEHAWAVGGRLVAVNGRAIGEVTTELAAITSHDNLGQLNAMLPDRLTDPMVLDGIGLADAEGRTTYRIALPDGSEREVRLGPGLWRPKAATGPDTPLSRRKPHLNYWNDYLAAEKLVYIQYNRCVEDPDLPFAKFTAGTLGFLDQNPVEKVVIDVRYNAGGDSRIAWPLIAALAERELKVYVIIGRHTFSSGLLNAMELDRDAGATLVGEPTGGKPSHYGEVKTFELPAVAMTVQYSTKFFEFPQYPGDAVAPELAAPPTAADHFAGRDAALEAILADGRELP